MLVTEFTPTLLSSGFGVTRLASSQVDDRIDADMVAKPYNLTDAVAYHIGTFPPSTLDYEVLLGPLEEAAASLARYGARMSGMVNSELFLAPLRRQDAVTSSRMEGTISTIEELYRLEAEEGAAAPTLTGRRATTTSSPTFTPARGAMPSRRLPKAHRWASI